MKKPKFYTLLVTGLLSVTVLLITDFAVAQKSKDTLRIGLREQVGLMSIIYNARPETGLFEREVLDALLSYNPQTKKYEGLLAQSWKQITPTTLNTFENQLIFINHATFLLQIDGTNILTDPIWSKRSGPFGRLGPSRAHNPGLRFEDLPDIDFVVISHNHFDHMDLPTLKKIEKKFKPIFIVGLGNSRYLKFIDKDRLIELDWWKSISFSDLEIFFVPAQHWSFRGRFDINESLWGGFFIQSSNNSVLFSGDTAEGPHFEMIRKKIGSPDLALIPIGAYLPREFMKPSHLGPSEAIDAFRALGAKKAIAMHFRTFPLGTDGPTQASKELKLLLTEEDLSERFKIPFPGMIQYLDN